MQAEVKCTTYLTGRPDSFGIKTEIVSDDGVAKRVQHLSSVIVNLQEKATQEALAKFGYVKANPSQEQCAHAWAAVADKLSQIFSNWTDFAPTGLEAALRAIQKLADEGHPEVYQEYKQLRRRCADLEQLVVQYKAASEQFQTRLQAVKQAVQNG